MQDKVVQCGDLKFKLLYTKQHIDKEVDTLAANIDKYLQGIQQNEPDARFLLVGILNGAFMFTSEVLRRLKTPVQIEFIKISSYKGTVSGQLNIESKIQYSMFKGAHIIILDDICDTGKTLMQLSKIFTSMEAKSIRIAVLVIRPDKKQHIKPDFYALTCSQFIVGYGLDYDQRGRQYPQIYQKFDE